MSPQIWVGPVRCWRWCCLPIAYLSAHRLRPSLIPVPPGVSAKVGIALYGPYLLGVELASMLLLAGLVGAYHLGRQERMTWPSREED